MMVRNVSCDQLPVLKLLLHAAKHPSCSVNGILLGSTDGDVAHVRDIVPLFHVSCHLAAPTEVALAQIEAFTQQPDINMKIVGYYHADSKLQSSDKKSSEDLPAVGRKIAEKIFSKEPSAVALVLDNKKLGQFSSIEGTHPFDLHYYTSSRAWKREDGATLTLSQGNWKEVQSEFVSLCKRRFYATFVDFDDHLDDVSKDYMNPGMVGLGKFNLPGQQR